MTIPRWLVRLTLGICFMSACMGVMPFVIARWGVGIDTQRNPSNPFRVYLHCKMDRSYTQGAYAPFPMIGFAPLIPDGTIFVKRIGATEGDHLELTQNVLAVNGKAVATVNPIILAKAGLSSSRLEGVEVVPPGFALMLGTASDSFDSRYYGLIPVSRLEGTAVPLW